MKEYFYKHHWTFLFVLFSIYCVVGFINIDCTWINAWLQTGAIAITIVFSVLLMIRSNRKSDEATQAKFSFYQEQHKIQIETIRSSTQAQIEVIKTSTEIQINSLRDFTQEQIKAFETTVLRQIDHQSGLSEKHLNQARLETEQLLNGFKESTDKQIDSFVQYSLQITDRLEDVVEHLATISTDNKEMLENEKRIRELEEKKYHERSRQLHQMVKQQEQNLIRYKPELQFCLEEEGVFFIDLRFILHNSGGDASSIQLDIAFSDSNGRLDVRRFSKVINNLKRNSETHFVLTRAKKLRAYDSIEVNVIVWDINQRNYNGNWYYDRADNQWFHLGTEEQRLL